MAMLDYRSVHVWNGCRLFFFNACAPCARLFERGGTFFVPLYGHCWYKKPKTDQQDKKGTSWSWDRKLINKKPCSSSRWRMNYTCCYIELFQWLRLPVFNLFSLFGFGRPISKDWWRSWPTKWQFHQRKWKEIPICSLKSCWGSSSNLRAINCAKVEPIQNKTPNKSLNNTSHFYTKNIDHFPMK